MGLLIVKRKSGLGITSFVAAWTTLAMLNAGCGSLKLDRPLRVGKTDWPTFARVSSRINATTERITPPLSLDWEYDITGGIGNGSPLIVDSLLIVGNLRGELYAINAYTGKRRGWVSFGGAIQGSPVVDGSTVIVPCSNSRQSLIAYNLFEGKLTWEREYGDIEVSLLLLDQKIYFGNTQGVFYCVDKANGEMVWKYEIQENTKLKGIRSSPACEGKTVIFGAEDGNVYALDALTGKQRWRFQTSASIVASPAVMDGSVYIGNLEGVFYSIDLMTGQPKWKFSAGTSIYASPSLANGLVIFGTTGGTMFALNNDDGSIAWETNVGSVVNSGAVVSGDLAYVGTLKQHLYAIRITDGTTVMKLEVPGRIKTSGVVAKGRLFIATDENLVLAYQGSDL